MRIGVCLLAVFIDSIGSTLHRGLNLDLQCLGRWAAYFDLEESIPVDSDSLYGELHISLFIRKAVIYVHRGTRVDEFRILSCLDIPYKAGNGDFLREGARRVSGEYRENPGIL